MNHASLFSGIGGFDLASEWMGWNNIFNCEINPFCKKVLKYYWPNAEQFDDIKTTDFSKYANKIDILTGGFPCQPYSSAGKRLGKNDSRHLWPYMLRAIEQIKPNWIVGENVFGITNWNGGMVFVVICTDLENQGYKIQTVVLPAASVNAPHKRDRIWFIANTNSNGSRKFESTKEINTNKSGINAFHDIKQNCIDGNVTNTKNIRSKYALDNKKMERRRFRITNKSNVWDSFPSESGICGGNDGLSKKLVGITISKHRKESLAGYGNAVVPQLVVQIFKTIEKLENERKMD